MPVTESFVGMIDQTPPTKKIDNTEVVTAQGAVQRQQIALADPENPNARTKIANALPAPLAIFLIEPAATMIGAVHTTAVLIRRDERPEIQRARRLERLLVDIGDV